jgi:iron complex outermembrane receptor protein
MRKTILKFLLTPLMLLMVTFASQAQNQITGTVTDSKTKAAISGATVFIKGSKSATQTGADGSFRINADAGATLQS